MSTLRQLLPPSITYALILFLLFVAAPELLLAADDEVTTGELRFIGDSGGSEPALLQGTAIDVQVSGMVARVAVRQTFENTSKDWVEGEYVFPLVNDSAVDYMAMKIGQRFIVGEVREKEEARQAFERARAQGKKASLVSQQRPNLFTTRVANIAPGETIMVELRYVETLDYDQGQFSLRLPTTLTPRYIPGTAFSHYQPTDFQNPATVTGGWALPTDQVTDAHLISPPMVSADEAVPLQVNATIDAGVALQDLGSRYHAATVSESNGRYTLNLQPGSYMNRDVVLEWTPRTGRAPVAALFRERIETDEFLLLMLMPPQQFEERERLARETIFIIDTSGSMSGVSIAQARDALLDGLARLSPRDRFNVIEFNSAFTALWPEPVSAGAANVGRARHFVQTLQANGGTNMGPALQRALTGSAPEGFVRQVVFITDGSVGNEAALFNLIEAQAGDSRVFTVGIGSAPNGHFMEKAARAGRGSYTYIASVNEVGEKMADLFYKLASPVVTDIQWEFEGAPADVYPGRVPDLYAGEPLLLTARLGEGLPAAVNVRGSAGSVEFKQRLELQQARPADSISKLWARNKLRELYEHERAPGSLSRERLRQEIVDVAISHRLLSRYTSFVAIEERLSRAPQWMLRNHVVPSAMPAGNTIFEHQAPSAPVALPPTQLASNSPTVPMPQGALGLAMSCYIAFLSLAVLLLVNRQVILARGRHWLRRFAVPGGPSQHRHAGVEQG